MTSRNVISEDLDNRSLAPSSVQYIAPSSCAGQAFEARGIYKLPLELLVEIFYTSLDLGVTRANIALINKHCNEVLISSPSLWKHMTLWLSTDGCNMRTDRIAYLERCLELSQTHHLSVRMDPEPSEYVPESISLTLSSVLLRCDTPRWESLTINHEGSGGEVLKDFKFPSLRSLSFSEACSGPGTPFHRAMFLALLQSRPTIEEITIPGEVIMPTLLTQGNILRSLRVATTSGVVAAQLPSSSSLQVLHITGYYSNIHIKDILLPLTVSLPWCSTHTLMELRLDRTQHLTIQSLQGAILNPDTIVKCPQLRSLSVVKTGFCSLVYITAPRLADLRFGMEDVETAVYRGPNNRNAIAFADRMRDFRQHFNCYPRFLKTRLPLTTEETMLLLEGSSQVEKVSIRVARPFRWRTWLAEGLVRKRRLWDISDGKHLGETWKICPRLRWLHLVTDWDEKESMEWKGHVMRVLRERGSDGLHCISWVCADGSEVVCSHDR